MRLLEEASRLLKTELISSLDGVHLEYNYINIIINCILEKVGKFLLIYVNVKIEKTYIFIELGVTYFT